MKYYKSLLLILILPISLLFFASCNDNTVTTEQTIQEDSASKVDSILNNNMMDTVSVPFVNNAMAMISGTYPDTMVSGSVRFEASDNQQVKMMLDITVPLKANKSVAVHLHEHGDCGDNGKASHGHWNPTNVEHGKWGSSSFHAGDIGNVKLDGKGKGSMELTTDVWTLGGKSSTNILNKAIIVHGGVDDYTTQPTGNAGDRIGCGIIRSN